MFERLCRFVEDFGFDRFNTFAYSNEEGTTAYDMRQIPSETIERRAEILGEIGRQSMQKSLDRMVGTTQEIVIDGISDEHEYLLSARPLNWAVEIDGEILINDTNDLEIKYGTPYQAHITQKTGHHLLATLMA